MNFLTDRKARTANMGLAIAGGQWLIEVLCLVSSAVLAESLVLRNARHRQAKKRRGRFDAP
jgi:hypothetical protein